MEQILQHETVNLIIAIIVAFTGTSIGGIVWRILLRKFTSKIELGVADLEKKGKISSDSAEKISNSVGKLEQMIADKIDNLANTVEAQNEKIVHYRQIIDYQIDRDRRISDILEKILRDLDKEGD